MVQDTSHSAEMYLSKYPDGSLGGWGIEPEHTDDQCDDQNIEYNNLRECAVLWAVNVPGESSWTVTELEGSEFGMLLPSGRFNKSSQKIGPSSSSQVAHRPPRPHKGPVPDQPHIGVKVKVNKLQHSVIDYHLSFSIIRFMTQMPPTASKQPTSRLLLVSYRPNRKMIAIHM